MQWRGRGFGQYRDKVGCLPSSLLIIHNQLDHDHHDDDYVDDHGDHDDYYHDHDNNGGERDAQIIMNFEICVSTGPGPDQKGNINADEHICRAVKPVVPRQKLVSLSLICGAAVKARLLKTKS